MARGGGGPATQSVASMTSAAAIRRSLQNREQLRDALGRQKVCAACVCPASEVGTNTQSSEPSRLGLDELVVWQLVPLSALHSHTASSSHSTLPNVSESHAQRKCGGGHLICLGLSSCDPQDKLRKLVKEWDEDGDGLISFPEFIRALKTCALAISHHLEACSSTPVGFFRRFAFRRFALQRAARLCSCTERFFFARAHPPG